MLGMHLAPTSILTEIIEDWSEVRSPARAARRLRRGHPQRIRYVQRASPQVIVMGNVIYAHPDIIARVASELPVQPMAAEIPLRLDGSRGGRL